MVTMGKQNRVLAFVVVFAIILLSFVLYRMGVFGNASEKSTLDSAAGSNVEDQMESDAMGIPVSELGNSEQTAAENGGSATSDPKEEQAFAEILLDLRSCLGFSGGEVPKAVTPTLENLMKQFPDELGAANSYDRWMNWHLRNREGNERRLRLEVTSNDEGRMVRELKWYAVDREGLPIPLELDRERSINPKDDTIAQMLREGEVFFREKAAGNVFTNGDRVDYVLRNDRLSEFEITKGQTFYRCASLKGRETCQCTR